MEVILVDHVADALELLVCCKQAFYSIRKHFCLMFVAVCKDLFLNIHFNCYLKLYFIWELFL